MYEIREIKGGITVRNVHDFNLFHIFECGQCFRWLPVENGGYRGVAHGRVITAFYDETLQELTLYGTDINEFNEIWLNYFDLETDYSQIKMIFSSKDKYMKASTQFGYGIRLLKQEPFETLISFIISANNNIPRIRKCIEALSAAYGKPIFDNENHVAYSFPKPEILASLTEKEISDCCKAGYRCKYIIEASKRYINNAINVSDLSLSDKQTARKSLTEFTGVGPKVADCILLFTGARRDVFPVDVWVARLMNSLYLGNEQNRNKTEKFASEYFGENAGIAQQYLFFYAREHFDSLVNII